MASAEQSSNSFVLYDHVFRTLGSILIRLTIQPFQSNQHDDTVLTGQAIPGGPMGEILKVVKKFIKITRRALCWNSKTNFSFS